MSRLGDFDSCRSSRYVPRETMELVMPASDLDPQVKSRPVLENGDAIFPLGDWPEIEWKAMYHTAFGHYLRTGRLMTLGEGLAECERKFNHHHDKLGRFASAPGGAGASSGGYKTSSIKSLDDAKALVARQNGHYLGKNFQCASLTKALAPEVGSASTWQRGEQVQGNKNIPKGTPIATFDYYGNPGTNGYGPASSPGGLSGSSHTGIYLGQNDQWLQILHQYSNSGGPKVTTIPWKVWNGSTDEAGNKYYTIDGN